MLLQTGRVGGYEIVVAIGAGGMGEEGQSPVIGHQSPADDRLTDFALTADDGRLKATSQVCH